MNQRSLSTPISPALQAAQERLMALRVRAAEERVNSEQLPVTTLQSPVSNEPPYPAENNQSTNTPITLPPHLGWDSPAVTATLRRRGVVADGDRQGLKPPATHTKPAESGLEPSDDVGKTAHCSLLTALSTQHSALSTKTLSHPGRGRVEGR
ncbi:MAG: hypothetical protein IPL78_27320 [Chloroflexi bacterium]|nr:hypothetical protein [Chloroflexota bacterium]